MSTTSAFRASSAIITSPMPGSGIKAALVLVSLWASAAPALDKAAVPEKKGGDHELAHRLHEQGVIVSLGSVIEKAQTFRRGDLLEVELKKKHARYVYEVKILDPEGQVWELKFEAKDGRLFEEELEKD